MSGLAPGASTVQASQNCRRQVVWARDGAQKAKTRRAEVTQVRETRRAFKMPSVAAAERWMLVQKYRLV